MRITKNQLRQIIKEELGKVLEGELLEKGVRISPEGWHGSDEDKAASDAAIADIDAKRAAEKAAAEKEAAEKEARPTGLERAKHTVSHYAGKALEKVGLEETKVDESRRRGKVRRTRKR